MNRGWPRHHRYPSEGWPVTDVSTVVYPGQETAQPNEWAALYHVLHGQERTWEARRKLGRRYRLERHARHWLFQHVNGMLFWTGVQVAITMITCAVFGQDLRHCVGVVVAPFCALITMKALRGWHPGRNAVRPPT